MKVIDIVTGVISLLLLALIIYFAYKGEYMNVFIVIVASIILPLLGQ